MALVKSFSVGNGDMYYIRHNSSNFTIIDCCLSATNRETIINEIFAQSRDKDITRFISTHPDDDHFRGIECLDRALNLNNFYCSPNNARKFQVTPSFVHYCKMRDNLQIRYFVQRGCRRESLNLGDNPAGIEILWPDRDNLNFINAQIQAFNGTAFNNLSLVARYATDNASFMWIGDLETDFMEAIQHDINLCPTDIVFAPHHGRQTGKLPRSWLERLQAKVIIIGEARTRHLNYYTGYNKITQNRAGDITFEGAPWAFLQ